MAYKHFGRIGDVWKHLPLCEMLSIEKPLRYVETNAAYPDYELAGTPEQAYGILLVAKHIQKSPFIQKSVYWRTLSSIPENYDGVVKYPGSPRLAMDILNVNANQYTFFDIEKTPLEKIEQYAIRKGLAPSIVCRNEDSVEGLFNMANENRKVIKDIRIRKAGLQDCEILCKIHVSSIRELGRTHYSEDEIDAWSKGRTPERYKEQISKRYVIIAEHHKIPVGFGTLDHKTGEIVQLYVAPEFALKGIGTLLLKEMIRKAREEGLCELHLTSSLNAEKFYFNEGFQAGQECKHRFPHGDEIDCISMNMFLV